jgi:flagellar biogenesis protein FliO
MEIDWSSIQTNMFDYGVRLISAILIFIIGKWIAKKCARLSQNLWKSLMLIKL